MIAIPPAFRAPCVAVVAVALCSHIDGPQCRLFAATALMAVPANRRSSAPLALAASVPRPLHWLRRWPCSYIDGPPHTALAVVPRLQQRRYCRLFTRHRPTSPALDPHLIVLATVPYCRRTLLALSVLGRGLFGWRGPTLLPHGSPALRSFRHSRAGVNIHHHALPVRGTLP